MDRSCSDWCEIIVELLPTLFILFLIGVVVGWLNAHSTIATECRKLGAFYVGNSVFKCVEEKNHE